MGNHSFNKSVSDSINQSIKNVLVQSKTIDLTSLNAIFIKFVMLNYKYRVRNMNYKKL